MVNPKQPMNRKILNRLSSKQKTMVNNFMKKGTRMSQMNVYRRKKIGAKVSTYSVMNPRKKNRKVWR